MILPSDLLQIGDDYKMVAVLLRLPVGIEGPCFPEGNRIGTKLLARAFELRLTDAGENVDGAACMYAGEFNRSGYLLFVRSVASGLRILKDEIQRHFIQEESASFYFYCFQELIWRPVGPVRDTDDPLQWFQAESAKDGKIATNFFRPNLPNQ